MLLGGIEAGGTKFVCGVGTEDGEIVERVRFPTTTPEETLERVAAFFADKPIEALGVGAFGPVDLRPDSPTYGQVTTTPKPHWSGFDLLGGLSRRLRVPVGFDTDVGAAALGEATWGAAQGLRDFVYMTVGTGVGAGVVVEGRLVRGMLHPEVGHMPIRRHPDDRFAGCCPYHGDCLEGMASGPAIGKRWGLPADALADRPEVWELEAYYLAQACVTLIYVLSPQRIVLGGGVMKQKQLFPAVRRLVVETLNGYAAAEMSRSIDAYIVPPALGDNAGLKGALLLARRALDARRR